MAEHTPQEIAAVAVTDWLAEITPAQPVGSHIKALADIVSDAIAADRQQQDVVHAAEVAQVRRKTLLEAARAECFRCQQTLPKQDKPGVWRHPFGVGTIVCPVSQIHDLIAQEEAAHVDA